MKLLNLAAAFLAGVYLGVKDVPIAVAAVVLLAALLLGGVLARKGVSHLAPALLLLALAAGLLRGTLDARTVSAVEELVDTEQLLTVQGVVRGTPELTNGWVRFRLEEARVQRAAGGAQRIPGDVLVTARTPPALAGTRDPPFFRSGDLVVAQGRLERPPRFEDFDYRAYLERQGIAWVMGFPRVEVTGSREESLPRRSLATVRTPLAQGLETALPEPQGGLARALLLGQRTDLPEGMTRAFRDSGTSHLLAISGLHVGVLLGLSLAGAAWALGRRRGLYLLVPLAVIWGYAALSGMSPLVLRAAAMGTLYLWAVALGRQSSVLPALGTAAAVMVGLKPDLLWDVSFQLSFTAMIGLALLASPLRLALELGTQRLLPAAVAESLPLRGLMAAIAVSAGAILGTLPLLAFYFHRFSLVGLPGSVPALPALPAALGLSLAAALADLLWPTLGLLVGWMAWLPLAYITGIARLFAAVPGAALDLGSFSGWFVVAYYAGLVGMLGMGRGRLARSAARVLSGRLRPSAEGLRFVGQRVLAPLPVRGWMLVATALVAVLVWLAALSGPDGRLHLTMMDVGAGDALLLETPGGYQVLIDGGPGRLDAVRGLGRRLPFWDRTLNVVVLTHPQQDHITGLLEVLRRYQVELVVKSGAERDTAEYAEWRRLTQDVPRLVARRGQELHFPDGTRLRILNPPEPPLSSTVSDVDNASVVLLISYGAVDLLLTGDIYQASEVSLVGRGLVPQVEVLKAAHHGSDTSSHPAFLEAAAPLVTLVSAGSERPHPEIRSRLETHTQGRRVLVTTEHGEIEITSDGEEIWVKTQRREVWPP